jgi:putative oxidoreductase
MAAALATAVELGGAVMLAVGLGGRVGAAALFILNVVAATSYPDLSEVGLKDHVFWGILLALFLVHGPGKLSIDHWIRRRAMPPGAGNRHDPE